MVNPLVHCKMKLSKFQEHRFSLIQPENFGSLLDKKIDDFPKLVWKSIAAAVAFAIWAIAVPTNDIHEAMGGAAVASFFAIVASPVLTAVDAILVRVFKW